MKNIDYESVGRNIKKYRQSRGFTLEELADRVGVSTRHIIYIESGTKHVSLELLVGISNTLDIPISAFLEDCLTSENDGVPELVSIINQCTDKEAKILIRAINDLYANISRFTE